MEDVYKRQAYDTSGIVTHMLISDGSGIGAVIDLTIRDACDTAGIRMRSHIGSTVTAPIPEPSDISMWVTIPDVYKRQIRIWEILSQQITRSSLY